MLLKIYKNWYQLVFKPGSRAKPVYPDNPPSFFKDNLSFQKDFSCNFMILYLQSIMSNRSSAIKNHYK